MKRLRSRPTRRRNLAKMERLQSCESTARCKSTVLSQQDGYVLLALPIFISADSRLQAGYLNSKALEIIMVANSGYRPGYVNFSCRIARSARSRDPPVNIIASLKAAADLDTGDLVERMGESFARGHKEASGGIIPAAEFEELMALMKIGEKPDPKPEDAAKKAKASPQKNNLMNYFAKK